MNLDDALKHIDTFLTEEGKLALKGNAYIGTTTRHALEALLDAVLERTEKGAWITTAEVRLTLDALDSYSYWELGITHGTLPVNNGCAQIEPGVEWEQFLADNELTFDDDGYVCVPGLFDTARTGFTRDEVREAFDSHQAACALEAKLTKDERMALERVLHVALDHDEGKWTEC